MVAALAGIACTRRIGCQYRYCGDEYPGPSNLGIHSGVADRTTKDYLADQTRDDADVNCCFYLYSYYGFVFLGIGFRTTLVDAHPGWLDQLNSFKRGNTQVGLRWYIIHAYSNFEHKVKSSLEERIKLMGLDDKFGDILVPTEEVIEMKDGQKRRSERKFFPGYVFVQVDMDDETWHLVKQIPKVLGFVGGSSDRPAPITDAEADKILQRVKEGVDKPRPKVLFEPGEVVRVIDGPFNDFSGVVEQVSYEKSRLQVAVQILGRSTPVELDFGQVEKG